LLLGLRISLASLISLSLLQLSSYNPSKQLQTLVPPAHVVIMSGETANVSPVGLLFPIYLIAVIIALAGLPYFTERAYAEDATSRDKTKTMFFTVLTIVSLFLGLLATIFSALPWGGGHVKQTLLNVWGAHFNIGSALSNFCTISNTEERRYRCAVSSHELLAVERVKTQHARVAFIDSCPHRSGKTGEQRADGRTTRGWRIAADTAPCGMQGK
jgi:hypothetical protein